MFKKPISIVNYTHTVSDRCKSKQHWGTTSPWSEWPSSERATKIKCCRAWKQKGIFLRSWWGCKWVQSLWETARRFLKKLNTQAPYDPAIPFLGSDMDIIIIWNDSCTPIFRPALFTRAETENQPRPEIGKWRLSETNRHLTTPHS